MSLITGKPLRNSRFRYILITVVANGKLVRDMWTEKYGVLKQDMRTLDQLSKEDKVPEAFMDLVAWAYVRRVPTGNPHRQYALVYAGSVENDDGVLKSVAIRFQGIVAGLDLRGLGNWKECV